MYDKPKTLTLSEKESLMRKMGESPAIICIQEVLDFTVLRQFSDPEADFLDRMDKITPLELECLRLEVVILCRWASEYGTRRRGDDPQALKEWIAHYHQNIRNRFTIENMTQEQIDEWYRRYYERKEQKLPLEEAMLEMPPHSRIMTPEETEVMNQDITNNLQEWHEEKLWEAKNTIREGHFDRPRSLTPLEAECLRLDMALSGHWSRECSRREKEDDPQALKVWIEHYYKNIHNRFEAKNMTQEQIDEWYRRYYEREEQELPVEAAILEMPPHSRIMTPEETEEMQNAVTRHLEEWHRKREQKTVK